MTEIISRFDFDRTFFKEIKCDDINFNSGAPRNLVASGGLILDAPTIEIGKPSQTVTIYGDLTTVNTTNLNVKDALMTLNKEGVSCLNSGFEIEENASIVASIKLDATDGSEFVLKPKHASNYTLKTPSLTANATILSDLSTIDRTKISAISGDANKVLINDGSGNVSSEAYLGEARGGLGVNVSSISNSKFLKKDANGDIVGVDAPSLTIDDYSLTLTKLADTTDVAKRGGMLMYSNAEINSVYPVVSSEDFVLNSNNHFQFINRPVHIKSEFELGSSTAFSGNADFKEYIQTEVTGNDGNIYFPTSEGVSNDSRMMIKVRLYAIKAGTYDTWYHEECCEFKNIGGTLTKSTSYNVVDIKESTMGNCLFEMLVESLNCRFLINGLSSSDVEWTMYVETFRGKFI